MALVLHQSKLGETKIKWHWETRFLKDLDRIDGEPMEFEWTIFPRFTTLGILDEIQKMMAAELRCEPEEFKGRIIFICQCTIKLSGEHREIMKCCSMCQQVPAKMLVISGPGCERKWYGFHVSKQNSE